MFNPATRIHGDIDDVVDDPPRAPHDGVVGEEAREQGRVKMVRIREPGVLLRQRGPASRTVLFEALLEQCAVEVPGGSLSVAHRGDKETVPVESFGRALVQPSLRDGEAVNDP